MRKLSLSAILVLIAFLTGCALALVPASSDPGTKIAQATELFNNQGRTEGAIYLLNQAVTLAHDKNDKQNEAIAQFYLGEIYLSPGPHFDYLKDPQRALKHYDMSIALYKDLKFYKNAAEICWMKSRAFMVIKNKRAVCKTLQQADILSKKPGAAAQDILPPLFSNGKLAEAIQVQQKNNKCK